MVALIFGGKMNLQEEWDRFLVDCWIADRGRSIRIISIGFQVDHGHKPDDYTNPLKLERFPNDYYRSTLDVFGFIAKYLPKLSNWLLAHVKNHKIDPETKEKIIQAMKPMKLPKRYGGIGQKKDGKHELNHANKEYQATITGNKISIALSRGRHTWRVTK